MPGQKYKILIADDSKLNRALLAEILSEDCDIIEAENGKEAVALMEQHASEFSMVLLDIIMPEMDGFGALKIMRQHHWLDEIPVVMITSARDAAYVDQAYEFGAADFISRPFDALVVHHRVVNTILLYSRQRQLMDLVDEQIAEKERQSGLMIDILSQIVEFRNGGSGRHVLHIRGLTELLLRQLNRQSDRYHFSQADISRISIASALHDVGKIAIDEQILNKPGSLDPEEFEIMKNHTVLGAEILSDLPYHKDDPLIRTAHGICRWHHERYDGQGYPDGLAGDDIPIEAQVVSLADVYDALTSKRVYKDAYSHEDAVRMILEGRCGVFNPLLLDCLTAISDELKRETLPPCHHSSAAELLRQKEELTDGQKNRPLEPENTPAQVRS